MGLGEYVPYPSTKLPDGAMFRLAVQKRVLGRHAEMSRMLAEAQSYLASWRGCVSAHEGSEGTFCYRDEFRELMRAEFDRAERLMDELAGYDAPDFVDFRKAMEYAEKWNVLQRTFRDTFYAHLAFYPAWLDEDGEPSTKRDNCADCRLLDAIAPPAPAFIALSAFFIPRAATLADGTRVPEGVLVHEKANEYHEIHEHVHGYVHEKKSLGERPHCEWIEEGIADWAAMNVTGGEMAFRSAFHEMYDFWLVLESLPAEERAELVRAWCESPWSYDWGRLVDEAAAKLREVRRATRGRAEWQKGKMPKLGISFREYKI
jgi:hypothetical protein